MTLKQAMQEARKATESEGEYFYVCRLHSTQELCIVRHRFLYLWLDDVDVIPRSK